MKEPETKEMTQPAQEENAAEEMPQEGTENTEEAAEDTAQEPEETAADEMPDADQEPDETTENAQPERAVPDQKDEKIRELNDRLLRQIAEFENFRRRTEKEKSQMFETGASSVIEKMLPVLDNFERAMATVADEEKSDPFVNGMDKIYKQLLTTFEQIGVTPIEAVGKEFDPQLHNAVMHIEDEAYGENEVAEEFQKGYKYHDSVVRHSMVKVAN